MKEFYKYKEEIEKKNDIEIIISKIKGDYKIVIEKIIMGKRFEVGDIFPTSYSDGLFSTPEHLAKEIQLSFRGQGYGRILFDTYKELSKYTELAELPYNEYSRKASSIMFLLKNGYKLKSKIINGVNKANIIEMEDNEIKEIINNMTNILKVLKENNDFLEQTLPNTYHLELEENS